MPIATPVGRIVFIVNVCSIKWQTPKASSRDAMNILQANGLLQKTAFSNQCAVYQASRAYK